MKKRMIAISAALATGTALLSPLPIQLGAVDAAEASTMADRSDPRLVGFPKVANPFEGFDLQWTGLSADSKISSISVHRADGWVADRDYQDDISISVSASNELRGYLHEDVRSEDGIARAEIPLLVVYTDGSIDRVTERVEIRPSLQRYAYQPYFRDNEFPGGKATSRNLSSLPSGSKVTLISVSAGWQARIDGAGTLEVTAPTSDPVGGSVALEVTYPDGSVEAVRVSVVRKWDTPSNPGLPDNEVPEVTYDKPGFDKSELDFSEEGSVPQKLRVVGLKNVPVDRIEILDENGWGYRRGKIGIVEFEPIRSLYGEVSDNRSFYAWAPDQESAEPVEIQMAVRVFYTDGTTEDVKSPIRVKPRVQLKCETPVLDASLVKPGEKSIIKMTGLPEGWPIVIDNLSSGAAARVTDTGDLEVIVPRAQDRLGLELSFPCTGDESKGMGLSTSIPMPWRESVPPRPFEPAPNPEDLPLTRPTTTVTSTVPTTVVSTVNGTPTTVTKERIIVSEVPVTEKTIVVEPGEPSRSDRTLTIVAVVFSVIAAIGGITATLLSIPGVRAHLPF